MIYGVLTKGTQRKSVRSVNLPRTRGMGRLGGSAVERVPSAQGVIPGSWDRVLHQALRREPASPSACVSASLYVSLMNK